MNQLTTPTPNAVFLVTDGDKNARSSVAKFVRWLDDNRLSWVSADLKAYLDYLTALQPPLAQSSVKKHMERVRARYKDMQHSNAVRDMIQARIPESADAANTYAITQEFLTRIQNNTEYKKDIEVKLPTVASYVDSDFVWLSYDEIDEIWGRIKGDKLGTRDAAIFALCLSYGLREFEACAITVEDLNETWQGKAGVQVKHGKGNKKRFIYRDSLADWTGVLTAYLDIEGIHSGAVLQGLQPRQLQNRVKLYTTAKPHDLRRTYAKLLHNGGRTVEYVRQQLGHVKVETTMIYLGMINR